MAVNTAGAGRRGMGSRIILFNEVILISVLALICVLIGAGSSKFFSSTNVLNVLRDSSMDVIAAIGMTMLLITGEVDLSIGSLVAFVGVVTMDVINHTHSVFLGVCAGLGLGLLTGFINGIVRTKLRVNSLIGTIAMMMVLRGGVYIYRVAAVQNYHSLDAFFQIGNGYIGFLPIPIFIMAVLYLGFLFVVTRTVVGRRLYASGGNATAARISGISVDRLKIGTFMTASLLAAVAGIILVSRMNSGQPNSGQGFEISVVAGVILGGTGLGGGEGTLVGTLIGVFILKVINNGIILLGWNQDLQIVIAGAVLIVAVYLDNKRKAARARIITV
jgi:ribose transport system permease protein